MVTEKYERQEELLSSMIKQRQATVNDHISGRKLMDDEVCIYFICLGYYCNLFIFRFVCGHFSHRLFMVFLSLCISLIVLFTILPTYDMI